MKINLKLKSSVFAKPTFSQSLSGDSLFSPTFLRIQVGTKLYSILFFPKCCNIRKIGVYLKFLGFFVQVDSGRYSQEQQPGTCSWTDSPQPGNPQDCLVPWCGDQVRGTTYTKNIVFVAGCTIYNIIQFCLFYKGLNILLLGNISFVTVLLNQRAMQVLKCKRYIQFTPKYSE